MKLVIDIETDSVIPDMVKNVWCVVLRDVDTDTVTLFTQGTGYEELRTVLDRCNGVIGHNCIAYDLPILVRLCGIHVDPVKVEDTLLLSQLHKFNRQGGHSLENLGIVLGMTKTGLDITDWSRSSLQMIDRCIQDTKITAELYRRSKEKLKNVPEAAIRVEHGIAEVCYTMHTTGFGFNRDDCISIIHELTDRLAAIDIEMQAAFPPKEVHLKTKVKLVPFNPRSPQQIVERLNEWGWKPVEFTPNRHPKVNETNLSTLPDTAPYAARLLIERLILSTRKSTLESWLSAYSMETGRIHGDFRPIGTWTHRMSHRSPNMGNIAAEKSIKYRATELVELATKLGGRLRGLWRAEDGCFLVGTDAESIQLRIFAHYIDDDTFTHALLEGKKDDGTDVHSRNARLLGVSRDSAKTFIYAFLLGAGNKKLGQILGCNVAGGKASKNRFIESYPGLIRLRERDIPIDAARGYFQGLDGRYVQLPGENEGERAHLCLAGYLQNGEAVIMKHAVVDARNKLEEAGIAYKIVNIVHDEVIHEVAGTEEDAIKAGAIQAEAIRMAGEKLNLRCPMSGNSKVGRTWLEVH